MRRRAGEADLERSDDDDRDESLAEELLMLLLLLLLLLLRERRGIGRLSGASPKAFRGKGWSVKGANCTSRCFRLTASAENPVFIYNSGFRVWGLGQAP